MSAIEQPAARSGSTTGIRSPERSGQPLGPIGQDVGRLGHEVDAAKRDRPTLCVGGGHLAELIAVAPQIGQRDHFVLLVMVSQNEQPRAHFAPHGRDPLEQDRVVQRLISLYAGVGRVVRIGQQCSWPT